MKSPLPRTQEIDELTQFLPRLYKKDFRPIREWKGGEKIDNAITMPWPDYEQVVVEFIEAASRDCWCDYQYVPEEASEMLGNPARIERASVEEIKTMLTFCIRGERFCDGHVGAMIEEGKIEALLKRLMVLRDDIPDQSKDS